MSATLDQNTNAPAIEYARLLRESQACIDAGNGDGPEADALADRMDGPWYAMTDREQHRMRGLSTDLYTLSGGGPKGIEMSAEAAGQWQAEAKENFERDFYGDVDAALAFLRKPFPSRIPPPVILYLQSRCWQRLGDLETALAFARAAERGDEEVAVDILQLLREMGNRDAVVRQAEWLITRSNTSPGGLYLAAVELLTETRQLGATDYNPVLYRVREALQRAQQALARQRETDGDIPNLDANIADALGLCLERLGDRPAALRVYSEALRRNPADADLLTSRGLALYSRDANAALRDFLAATRAGARSMWPWHILARHALLGGAVGEAWRLGLKAIERPGNSTARAEAHLTVAISQALLAQPIQRVLEHLDEANRLDPANERIQSTLLYVRSQSAPVRTWARNLLVEQLDSRQFTGREDHLVTCAERNRDWREAGRSENLLCA